MKKRFGVTAIVLAVFLLTACSNSKKLPENSGEGVVVSSTEVSGIEAGAENKEDSSVSLDDGSSEDSGVFDDSNVNEDIDKDLWLYSSYYDSIYRIEDDTVKESFSFTDLTYGANYVGVYERKAIGFTNDYDENYNSIGSKFIAADIDSGEIKTFGRTDSADSLVYSDIVGNKLVILYKENEINYQRVFNLDTLDEEPVEMNNYLLEKNAYLANYDFSSFYYKAGADRIMAENGQVIWDFDKNFVLVDESGRKELGPITDGNPIDAYRKNKVFYSAYSDDYSKHLLFMKDIESGEVETISENIYQSWGIYEDKVYFSEMILNGINKNIYSIMEFDMNSLVTKEIARCERHLGMDGYIPGTDLQISNGKVYYLYDDEKTTGWFSYDIKEKTTRMLSGSVKDYPIFELGKVKSLEDEAVCSKCGKGIGGYSYEYFVFDTDKDARLEKINKLLYEKVVMNQENFFSNVVFVEEEFDCEEHGETYATYTDEENVGEIAFLSDNYVLVNTSGYDYAGGAHGMPYRTSAVYDLNESKAVDFMDLYQGSFEDLRVLFATKTKEDFESYAEKNETAPYFSDDPDRIYEEAYNFINNEDYIPIIWMDGYVYITYSPYVMGPYASGFIQIPVSYEELGIKFN